MDKDKIMKNEPKVQKTQAKPTRKPYVKPEAIYIELLEAYANVCDPNIGGKVVIDPEDCYSFTKS